jgi:hypothetical protein
MVKIIVKCDTVSKLEPNIEGYKEGTVANENQR